MIDDFQRAVQIASIKLPDRLWAGAELIDGVYRLTSLSTDDGAMQKWAIESEDRLIFALTIPEDTVVYGVEKVPATTKLVQVKP